MRQIINSNIEPNWPNIEVDFPKKIKLFIDSLDGYDEYDNSFKILYLKEAEVISKFAQIAIKNHKRFDAIITYEEEVLNNCPNAHFLEFGTTWIHNYEFSEKKFQISHLTGNKAFAPGHMLRLKTYYKQEYITTSKDFYVSSNSPRSENPFNNKFLKDSKNVLFNSQFHICIENSKQKNYFSEKLIDCFITKTVPIYYGCPNISDYFNTKGIFIVDNVKDIVYICNNLNEQTYNSMKGYVDDNFELAQKYIDLVGNLNKVINKILNI